jgi:hypothetical protein
MKIKSNKTDMLENVTMRLCDDCKRWVVDVDGEELDSMELLANEYKFIEIDRSEIGDFNKYMDSSREMVQRTWDYYMGMLDKDEPERDDKKN